MATVVDDFNAEFIFTWKIKNFSHCLPWTWIRSPTFIVESMDKTKWCLQLWPREYTNGIHMEYYLAREENDSGPELIRVAYELSFLNVCGRPLLKKSREASFTRDTFKGFSEYVEQSKVYIHRKNEYLPEDTLTACCKIKQIGRKPSKPVFCFAISEIGVEQISFDWSIKHFSKLRPGTKKTMVNKSPFIKVELYFTAKPEEALQFAISHAHMEEPNLTDCEIGVLSAFKDTLYIKRDSRYLEGKIWNFPIFVKRRQLVAEKDIYLRNDILALKFIISISLGVVSSVINSYESRSPHKDECLTAIEKHSSTVDETTFSYNKIIGDFNESTQKLLNGEEKNVEEIQEEFSCERLSSFLNGSFSSTNSEESTSLKNESFSSAISEEYISLGNGYSSPTEDEELSLFVNGCSPTQNKDSSSNDSETISEFQKLDNDSNSMEELVSTSNIKNELQRFYQDGTFSDINLTAGEETFQAHRLILSLKSHKFKEIFMNDPSKKSIKVSDVDSGTLRDLLDFIYTNNVNDLTFEKAQNLILAAESYKVMPLKQVCLTFMKDNIDESNACRVLILADKRRDEEVKQMALKFIINHGKAIMNTKAWDELTKQNIKLAFETMQHMYLNKT